jgi:hypothetical protein
VGAFLFYSLILQALHKLRHFSKCVRGAILQPALRQALGDSALWKSDRLKPARPCHGELVEPCKCNKLSITKKRLPALRQTQGDNALGAPTD